VTPANAQRSEEDRLVRWGWALGLVLPVVGLMIAAVLGARGDHRWTWMTAWALVGVAIYSAIILLS
jgi:hypothetical protein